MASKSTGAQPNSSSSSTNRQHHDGSTGRAFTSEQKAAVIRIRACTPTAFYDILGLETERTTVSDAGIKKAYRKLSLLTHPDKNGYDGADEAFKMVSRAFQILSDPDKKQKYDKFGGDPDSRFGAGGGGGGGGFSSARSPFGNGFARAQPGFGQGFGGRSAFEGEISPEELFRQFFGGGMGMGGGPFGGGLFDTSPGFVFNMGGGPGVRVHQFGGGRPRTRPGGGNAQELNGWDTFRQMLPLLVFFVIPLISSLFTGFGGDTSPRLPKFSLDEALPPVYTEKRTTRSGVDYFMNPKDIDSWGSREWRKMDGHAEQTLASRLSVQCDQESTLRRNLVYEAQGWFFTDQVKLDEASRFERKACDRLRKMGYRVDY